MSIGVTWFIFGQNNNIFPIPYLLHLVQLPDFADDAFYKSLDKFTSALWPLLRPLVTSDNIVHVFFVCAFLSRMMALMAIAFVFHINGVRSAVQLIAGVAVIAATPLMTGYSPIGAHGLFIPYFTHTELTWPFVFMALAMLQGGRRLGASAMFSGLAFVINAFVGIWLIFISVGAHLFAAGIPRRKEALKYVGVLLLVCSPVLVWIGLALSSGGAVSFSYIEYVRFFYPNHFLIEAATAQRLVALAVVFACGLVASLYTASPRFWCGTQLSIFVLLFVGAALPYLLNTRLVFNLHLLRADGMEQGISIVLCVLAGIHLLCDRSSFRARSMGIVVLTCLLTWPKSLAGASLPLVGLALLAGLDQRLAGTRMQSAARFLARSAVPMAWICAAGFAALLVYQLATAPNDAGTYGRLVFAIAGAAYALRGEHTMARGQRIVLALCVALTICISSVQTLQQARASSEQAASEADWTAMQAWVRTSDLHGVFLVSLESSDYFQLDALRPVWVGGRQGAAVMWEPSFYAKWRPREEAVRKLHTAEQYLTYARAQQIPYVVLGPYEGSCASDARLIKQTGAVTLCEVGVQTR